MINFKVALAFQSTKKFVCILLKMEQKGQYYTRWSKRANITLDGAKGPILH